MLLACGAGRQVRPPQGAPSAGPRFFSALLALPRGWPRMRDRADRHRAAEGCRRLSSSRPLWPCWSGVFPAGPARNRAFAVWGGLSAAAGTPWAGRWRAAGLGGRLAVGLPDQHPGRRVRDRGGLAACCPAARQPSSGTARRAFDAVGALAATAGASLLAYAVVQTGSHPWGSARTVTLLAGGRRAARLLPGARAVHRGRTTDAAVAVAQPVGGRRDLGRRPAERAVRDVRLHHPLPCSRCSGTRRCAPASRTCRSVSRSWSPRRLAPALVPWSGIRLTATAGVAAVRARLPLLAQLPGRRERCWPDVIVPDRVVGLRRRARDRPDLRRRHVRRGPPVAGLPPRCSTSAGSLAAPSALRSSPPWWPRLNHARAGGCGHAAGACAVTAGFRAGFMVSAMLLAGATAAAQLVLLREDGRGQRRQPNRTADGGRLTARAIGQESFP